MGAKIKVFYALAVLVPLFLGYLIWDIKGDVFELTGNIRVAQYMDREGKVIFPQDILFVERHLDNIYMDKSVEGNSSLLIFGQRNPDLPNYSVFLKILGDEPEQMKGLFNQIADDFKKQSKSLIENVKMRRRDQLQSIETSIAVIDKFESSSPGSLKDGESFMSIYNQLNELKEKREFLEVSLNENSIFNFYPLDTPTIKKKRDKGVFMFSLFAGMLFLMLFLLYLIWRVNTQLR